MTQPTMTNSEVMAALRSDSLLSKARAVFSEQYATLEQSGFDRVPPTPVEYIRMEFEAIKKIAAVLGVEL